MPIATNPTRDVIRSQALIRLGFTRDGDAPNRITDALNQAIQSEHTHLHDKLVFARRRLVITETLNPGDYIMQVPDETSPGQLEFVWATDLNGEPYVLTYAVPTPGERRSGTRDANAERPPRIWWLQNGELHISPAASENWPSISIQYLENEIPVREDTAYIQIDEELLIRAVVAEVKDYLGEDTSRADAKVQERIESLRTRAPRAEATPMIPMPHISRDRYNISDRVNGIFVNRRRANGSLIGPDGSIWPNGGPYT